MNASVDVLAVLDGMAWRLDLAREPGGEVKESEAITMALALRKASGAVVALIEAAEYAYPEGDYSQDAHGYAVRAALANVKGGAA